MADFNFLTGQSGAPMVDPNVMPEYQAPWMQQQAYPSITPGQSGAVTQGLDWGKLGQWALNQPATQSGGYQQALTALGGITQPTNAAPNYSPLQAGHAGGPLGQVDQKQAGYIGHGMTPQLLQSNFLRAR